MESEESGTTEHTAVSMCLPVHRTWCCVHSFTESEVYLLSEAHSCVLHSTCGCVYYKALCLVFKTDVSGTALFLMSEVVSGYYK